VIACINGDSNEDTLLHGILCKFSVHCNNFAAVLEHFPAGLRANKQTPKSTGIRIKIELEVRTRIGRSKLII
jgi:hypothetical protein